MAEPWTVIGIGNPMRGDDGVGAVGAARVRGMPGIDHVIGDGDPFEVAELLSGPHNVLLIDATRGGGDPGRRVAGTEFRANLERRFNRFTQVRQGCHRAVSLGAGPVRIGKVTNG